MEFGFVDLVALVFCAGGYYKGKKRGIFASLYKILPVVTGVFMFYRFREIFRILADKWQPNAVYSLGLLGSVLAIMLVFRFFWFFLHKFIDMRPTFGIYEIIAGMLGLFYGLIWMGIILKVLQYSNLSGVRHIIPGTMSARFIMPIPFGIYEVVANILKIVTPGGV
ncbi:MAG: CvpA family protein [Candidatus Saelkia tenebricola]|nr:CvpA family protein [Candidatus Saelkia tenebricola]